VGKNALAQAFRDFLVQGEGAIRPAFMDWRDVFC
jgi:hypothetical protein